MQFKVGDNFINKDDITNILHFKIKTIIDDRYVFELNKATTFFWKGHTWSMYIDDSNNLHKYYIKSKPNNKLPRWL
jgi:hypothetical protein